MFKLLIVDDSNIIRRKIQRSCDSARFRVVGLAENGVQALKEMKHTHPDVVTMDLTMPQMDGIQCVKEMVKINPNIRILVVSALSDFETGIEALENGARGFLCKPFSDAQLTYALLQLTENTDV